MSQQILNDNQILNIYTQSAQSNKYADMSSNQFDLIMDVANKAYENQNVKSFQMSEVSKNPLAGSKNIASKTEDLSSSKVGIKNNSINTNTQDNKKIITETETSNRDSSSTIDNTKNSNNSSNVVSKDSKNENDTNNIVSENIEETEVETSEITNNLSEDETTNDAFQEDVIKSEDIPNENEDISKDIGDNKVLDALLQYNISENIKESTDACIENDIAIDITDSDLDSDSGSDISVDIQDNLIGDDKSSLDLYMDNKIISQPILNVSDMSIQNVSEIKDDQLTVVADTLNITISDEISDINIDLNSNKFNKDLISQEMIDDLNITIEDVAIESSISDVELIDSSIMDSTEQVIKYNIEKTNDIESTSINLNKNEIEYSGLENSNNIDVEDIPVLERVVPNSQDIDDNSQELVDDQDVDNIIENQEVDVENTEFESETSEENNTPNFGHDMGQKENERKTSIKSKDIEDSSVYDLDVDLNSMQSKSGQIVSEVGVIGKTSQINSVLNAQTTSQTNSQTYQVQDINKEDIIAQIHNKLQSLNNTNNTKLTMVLNPESLGKVQIQLANTKDGMVAELLVSSQNVKDILDTNISQLKDTLTAHGVQVNDVSVKINHSENNAQMDYTEQENQNSNKHNQEEQKQNKEKDENKFEEMFSNSKESIKEDIN